jgi:hypothetical protein
MPPGNNVFFRYRMASFAKVDKYDNFLALYVRSVLSTFSHLSYQWFD